MEHGRKEQALHSQAAQQEGEEVEHGMEGQALRCPGRASRRIDQVPVIEAERHVDVRRWRVRRDRAGVYRRREVP